MNGLKVIITVCLTLAALSAQAVVPLYHPTEYLFQAYAGDTNGVNTISLGFNGSGEDNITAAAGIFSFDPGLNWKNFITPAKFGKPYSIKSLTLKKQTPSFIQCSDVYYTKFIAQSGSKVVRKWWPLMYEAPGTKWTLNILTGTSSPWDDDGAGPNPASYVHNDIWTWQVDADLDSMANLVNLFHQIPFGLDEVPLISDEVLFQKLKLLLNEANSSYVQDPISAGLALSEFELAVMDACIGISPQYPNATGPGTGIAQTYENPACCKLLVDTEYVAKKYGLFGF